MKKYFNLLIVVITLTCTNVYTTENFSSQMGMFSFGFGVNVFDIEVYSPSDPPNMIIASDVRKKLTEKYLNNLDYIYNCQSIRLKVVNSISNSDKDDKSRSPKVIITPGKLFECWSNNDKKFFPEEITLPVTELDKDVVEKYLNNEINSYIETSFSKLILLGIKYSLLLGYTTGKFTNARIIKEHGVDKKMIYASNEEIWNFIAPNSVYKNCFVRSSTTCF